MNDNVEVWYFMIPVAMVFVGIAIALFFWSVKSDQFEDLDRHGSNILFDDDDASHQQAQCRSLTQQEGVQEDVKDDAAPQQDKRPDDHSA
ncbi:cytochrome oxidase maturation protein Cbb3 [Oceanisphaera marina]|uniref:Cytochrome oxidase maturation protein Cbb3 n=1 Tax=Oceanisphaera marina TaxID=2017550 RepID=A0ABQ1IG79_9GAMM|nr:cytochrome oxidase maturation protein Cbb3 [Oceanisphaera marina]